MQASGGTATGEMATSIGRAGRLTPVQWLICLIAGVGFLFDTFELVVQALVVRPALLELTDFAPGSPRFNSWVGVLLFLPALAGGVAGLGGGWIVDRYGRRRALVASILMYGAATVMAGFSASTLELLVWRCATIAGVTIEWIAATTWIAENFGERRHRDAALGLTQAMGSVGVFAVGIVYIAAVAFGPDLPAVGGSHSAWRYALLFGAFPVIPVLAARLLLPESPAWAAMIAAGRVRRAPFAALFRDGLSRRTLAATALVACVYAIGYGGLQHVPRIVPELASVRTLAADSRETVVGLVHVTQDVGAILGRFAMAALLVAAIARRSALRHFLVPAVLVVPVFFLAAPHLEAWTLAAGAFVAAFCFNGALNFIGNYLPQIYPAELRGTGDGFAISVGGRMIGTAASLLTPWMANLLPGNDPTVRLGHAAALVATGACLLALLVTCFMIEPDERPAGKGSG